MAQAAEKKFPARRCLLHASRQRGKQKNEGRPFIGHGFGAASAEGVPAGQCQPAFDRMVPTKVLLLLSPGRAIPKGAAAMIYGEPETSRFLAAVQRIKREQRRKARRTRLAKQRVRAVLRKMREC